MDRVRIDKWLWAARFFKTRSLAKSAIEGGKIHIGGQRIKPSKEIEPGAVVTVRTGWDELEVNVLALAEKRGSATIAATLYQETDKSLAKRETNAAQRKAIGQALIKPAAKPNSKQRRKLQDIKRLLVDD